MAEIRIVSSCSSPFMRTFFAAHRAAVVCGSRAYTRSPTPSPYFEPFRTHRTMHFLSGVMSLVTWQFVPQWVSVTYPCQRRVKLLSWLFVTARKGKHSTAKHDVVASVAILPTEHLVVVRLLLPKHNIAAR